MNIHEYQAKALFKEFGVPIQDGVAVKSADEFESAIASLPGDHIVVKSQIHAGGRGKGVFADGFQGGVKYVAKSEAADIAKKMLGNTLITKQTGPQGERSARFSSRKPSTSTRSTTSRFSSTELRAKSQSWRRSRAAWTSKKSRRKLPNKS